MARYQDDSNSSRTLLIGAGVTAGLLAGALLAHRYGGWTGIRRRVSRSSGPLLAAVRAAIPSRTFAALLEVIDLDDILAGLLAGTRRTRRVRGRGRRRPDPDLDEYEVEDFERAAAGLEEEDEDEDGADEDDAFDDFDEEEDEDPDSPIARLRRFRHASAGDLEEDYEDEDEDEDDEEEEEEVVEDDDEDETVVAVTPQDVEEALLAAFNRHPILRERAFEISVDEDGVAELTGWVRRERDIRTARRVAARVPGVERVIVDVAVRDGVRAPADADVTGG